MPITSNKLRAAEVFDGGIDFEDADVQCTSDGDKMQITCKMLAVHPTH